MQDKHLLAYVRKMFRLTRKRLKMTQQEVAKASAVCRQTYANFETGVIFFPEPAHWQAYFKALRLDPFTVMHNYVTGVPPEEFVKTLPGQLNLFKR
ncbi:MAG: helix-turn-helix transcriptional regulator [Acidobacteriaceae bacterium]